MDIKTNINKKGERLTKQRQAILSYLQSVYSHPTAETIFRQVRKKIPNISLGTVYRNLHYLQSNGYLIEISSKDSKSHFDANIHSHDHFICEICDSITDLKARTLFKRRCSAGKISSGVHYYFGICNKCLKE